MATSLLVSVNNALFYSFSLLLLLPSASARAPRWPNPPIKPEIPHRPTWKPQGLSPALLSRLPNDTWDSHMHNIDPARYPLAADAAYTPSGHSLWDAVSFENSVSMKNIVVVQPSIYGNDNTALLDALRGLGPDRSRGVVVFDSESIDNTTLTEWHELGVRGVRLNLASTDAEPDPEAFARTLRDYAAIIKPFGWTLQVYMSMDMMPTLAPTFRDLDVKVCFDHFAQPTMPNTTQSAGPFDPYTINGFADFIELLKEGRTWVKFSAPYRVDLTADQLDVMAREILAVRNDRVVYATDWPHTRFEGLDIRPFEARCLEWAEDAKCVDKVFSTNAHQLWDISR
ncbi:amidohydrolase 2 [Hortaea werneckii]|uniref:Amidohydrolase-related domain-containing protein n=2 Tax=Hortaea werneckii TaxID=91943 RepID=A0A3M7ICY1_HORWE|nr:amidohydrolase 2 [Hortaea werneckii]OTA32030.1 hypothetical protein BTJ68_07358 [Hortaea werneckii EXF-2000]KAI6845891.1 amidohydrolase 2 [Hortaea werneckii]KAI6935450.1 amidohydrolase 2 [Hortaea werneckii]KAI6937204.1 amidohydrolase 2 [Hortaea werneckii]